MCGIYGIVDYNNKLTEDQKQLMLRILGVLNEDRGRDAAGFCFLDKDNKKHIHKVDSLARYLDFREIKDAKVIIGHTRQGTIGEKTVKQAHPFEYRGWVSTHNGTAYGVHRDLSWANGPSGVDSETLLRHLVYLGGPTKEVLTTLKTEWSSASYAMAMISDDNKFYAFRETSPLTYVTIMDDVLIYSSLESHLISPLIFLGIDYDKVKTLEENERIVASPEGIVVEKFMEKKYSYGNTYNGRSSFK